MCPVKFSYSTQPIPRDNAEILIPKAKWKETEGTVTDIIRVVKEDKALINNFHHKGEFFRIKGIKNQENLKSAYLIMLDYDAVHVTAKDFFNLMSQTEIQPTLVYTTAHNGKPKHDKEVFFNRFHVIYLLNYPIREYWIYKSIHEAIEDEIELMTDIKNDKTDHSADHLFCGNPNAEIYTSDSSYDVDFFIERYDVDTTPPTEDEVKHTGEKRKSREKHSSPVIDDFWEMDLSDFFYKYQGAFENIMATPLEESPHERIVEFPKDYLYIYRSWHIEEFKTYTGLLRLSKTDRLQKGERNKKLFVNLSIRRQITPTLSFENLLHNAVYELIHHVDNDDGSFTRYELFSIVESAYSVPVEQLHYTSKRRHEYRISRAYCMEHGTTPRQENIKEQSERRKKRKAERNAKVLSLYNPSLNFKENLSVLQAEGIDISKKTLQRILLYQGGQINDNIIPPLRVLQLTCAGDTKEKMLSEIEKNPTVTRKQLSEILNVGEATIGRSLKQLTDDGVIRREGGRKQGLWIIQERQNRNAG